MNNEQIDLINKDFSLKLNNTQQGLFTEFENKFIQTNSVINLISKNDTKFLFEKHIYDSLSISKFLKPKENQNLLDIGTGGGFPAIPIAIAYPLLNITALDSIKKKVKTIEDIKFELNIKNLTPKCERVENIIEQFDYVTARAVSSLEKIIQYATPKLKQGGYFIAYKSVKADEEIAAAKKIIKLCNLKLEKIVSYKIPMQETFERKLIIFKKIK